jgi:hypothetical protein
MKHDKQMQLRFKEEWLLLFLEYHILIKWKILKYGTLSRQLRNQKLNTYMNYLEGEIKQII